jgi:hypothetical protein
MQANQNLGANELMEILSRQIRTLDSLDLSSKNASKEISRSKEIFNGAGKVIKLAEFAYTRHINGESSSLLLPENK